MTLTKKEQGLLKDLQNEEKLCVEKYRKAAENACDAKLQHIFEKIEKAEQSHYDTVTGMLAGTLPAPTGPAEQRAGLPSEGGKGPEIHGQPR